MGNRLLRAAGVTSSELEMAGMALRPSTRSSTGPSDANGPLYAGREWPEFAELGRAATPLGQAVRQARRFFTDEEIVAAITGTSRTVALTVVDLQPVFFNAAMISDVLCADNDFV